VAELADAPDLGSGSERIRGSSPLARTSFIAGLYRLGTFAGFAQGAFHILAGFARGFLDAANQFIFLAVHELKIIVGELGPFLFHFAFGDVPIAFNLKFIHKFLIRFVVCFRNFLELRTAGGIGRFIPGIGGPIFGGFPGVGRDVFGALPGVRGAFFHILGGRIRLGSRIISGAA
jgi:hypothetical protein